MKQESLFNALMEYYDNNPNSAPCSWGDKEIQYIIELDKNGEPLDVISTIRTSMDSGKETAKSYLVPITVKRSINIAASILWDNPGYVIGDDKDERSEAKRKKFLEMLDNLNLPNDPKLNAVKHFMSLSPDEISKKLQNCSGYQELCKRMNTKSACNITFKINGDEDIILQSEYIRDAVNTYIDSTRKPKIFSISGKEENEATEADHQRLALPNHPTLISFNYDSPCSGGRKSKNQLESIPVGVESAHKITTAINTMLKSENKIKLGDIEVIIWCNCKENPNKGINFVKALFTSPKTGESMVVDSDTEYYILGLSPNTGRAIVRFWFTGTAKELYKNIELFYKDIEMVQLFNQNDSKLTVQRLLQSIVPKNKLESLSPNLMGDFVHAILTRSPYPKTLLHLAVQRNKIEGVTYQRAALIKAYINRNLKNFNKEKLTMTLNEKNKHVGYRLGRLFAVLTCIQQRANGNVNASIENNIGGASTNPATNFVRLMKLAHAHLDKLGKKSKKCRYHYEKLIAQIMGDLNDDSFMFPQTLSIQDQGLFHVGYYQQKASEIEAAKKRKQQKAECKQEEINETDDEPEEEEDTQITTDQLLFDCEDDDCEDNE